MAVTAASFAGTNDGSATSAVIVTLSPGSTRSADVVRSTGSGTPSTSHRSSCRVKVSCVWSSTLMLACICQSHESCGVNATDLPRPKR